MNPSEKKTMSTMPRFEWPIRIYYEDTDAGGIVYYPNYLKFFERARTEWLNAFNINQRTLANELDILFVVRNASVEYEAPAYLGDQLNIISLVKKIGNTSIIFQQKAVHEEVLLAKAEITVVCVKVKKIEMDQNKTDFIASNPSEKEALPEEKQQQKLSQNSMTLKPTKIPENILTIFSSASIAD